MLIRVEHENSCVVVDLFHCLLFHPLFVGVLCLVLALLCCNQCPFQFCSHLEKEEKAGCFTCFSDDLRLIVLCDSSSRRRVLVCVV